MNICEGCDVRKDWEHRCWGNRMRVGGKWVRCECAQCAYPYPPKNPIRDVLHAMTGKDPPDYVRGYSLKGLTGMQNIEMQEWCASNVRPAWLTGIGLMNAAESQVAEAVTNGDLPPEPSESGGKP